MKRENTAKGLMAVAMFIFGTLAPFVRNIDVSSGELALYRAVLAAVLVGGREINFSLPPSLVTLL